MTRALVIISAAPENIRLSYSRGRRGYWDDKRKPPLSTETKMKMANAKKKPIRYTLDGHNGVFDSIETASAGLGTYRKNIYLAIKNDKPFRGGWLEYITETI